LELEPPESTDDPVTIEPEEEPEHVPEPEPEPARIDAAKGKELVKEALKSGGAISTPGASAKPSGKRRGRRPSRGETVKARKARERTEAKRKLDRKCADAVALAKKIDALIPAEMWNQIDALNAGWTPKRGEDAPSHCFWEALKQRRYDFFEVTETKADADASAFDEAAADHGLTKLELDQADDSYRPTWLDDAA
jgi:hypothetical protein